MFILPVQINKFVFLLQHSPHVSFFTTLVYWHIFILIFNHHMLNLEYAESAKTISEIFSSYLGLT